MNDYNFSQPIPASVDALIQACAYAADHPRLDVLQHEAHVDRSGPKINQHPMAEPLTADEFRDDYMSVLNDEEMIPNVSLDDMKFQHEEENLPVKDTPLEHQPVDELIDAQKDTTNLLPENVKDEINKSKYVNVVKADYKPPLETVFAANIKSKKKKCGLQKNYVLRSIQERKKRLAMALGSPYGQLGTTTPAPPKTRSMTSIGDTIVAPEFEVLACLDLAKKAGWETVTWIYGLILCGLFESPTQIGLWYHVPWRNVEKVYFPVNEPERHWCLAELQISTGVVTFYDTLGWVKGNRRPWWRNMKRNLPQQLTSYLNEHGVLASKGISVEQYEIKYAFPNVVRQADDSGDCGVWERISKKRTKNEAKNDKTGHGMEKRGKDTIVKPEVKRSITSSSNSGSQNLAFISDHSSTNDVNTANVHVSTCSTHVSTASTNNSTACLSDATMYAYLATQPNGSQIVLEDLEQIHEDDLDEMDLKWQLALLSMKARKFYQRNGKKIIINGSDTAGYDKKKVECFNCHKLGHFARECRNPRSQENRSKSQNSSRRLVNVEESSSKAMLAIDGTGFDWSYMADEEDSTNFALMAFSDSEVQNNKTCSKTCLKNFEDLKSSYDKLRIELSKSESDLYSYKKGLESMEERVVFYKKNERMLCDQIAVLKSDASFNESGINALKKQVEILKKEKEDKQFKIENFENASKSLDQLIANQISDKNKMGLGYNAFLHPLTGLFAPPSIDLSNSGLEKFKQPEFKGYGVKVNKDVSENVSKEVKKNSDAQIIEDWVSDCDEDETVVLESLNVQKPKQADQSRKPGLVPFSTARQSFSRTTTPVSAARSFKTAAPKPSVNVGKQKTNAFQKQILLILLKEKRMTSAVGKQGINAVKPTTYWAWRPKIKMINHVYKNTGSCICKQFNYVDPTGRNKSVMAWVPKRN
ncbi:ribonuclease H-like domain-containing protein [Tanacetum coccineum]